MEGNIWYLYEDARLEGSGYNDASHLHEWKCLSFCGSYVKGYFKSIKIGSKYLNITIDILLDHRNQSWQKVRAAMFRPIVTISEAKRFHLWFDELQQIFKSGVPHTVGMSFHPLFTDWSNISGKIINGPLEFKPFLPFQTYAAALSALAVVLRRTKLKKTTLTEAEFKNPVLQFDADYDIVEEEGLEEEEEKEKVDLCEEFYNAEEDEEYEEFYDSEADEGDDNN